MYEFLAGERILNEVQRVPSRFDVVMRRGLKKGDGIGVG